MTLFGGYRPVAEQYAGILTKFAGRFGGLVIDFNLILPPNPLPVVQDGGGRDKAVPSGEGIGVVGLKIPHSRRFAACCW